MQMIQTIMMFIFLLSSTLAVAQDDDILTLNKFSSTSLFFNDINQNTISGTQFIIDNQFFNKKTNDDWIKVNNTKYNPLTVAKNQDLTFGDELAIAWNLSDFLSVNLSLFENQQSNNFSSDNQTGFISDIDNNLIVNKGLSNKSLITNNFNSPTLQLPSLDVNRNLSGYKLGISSQLGFGNDYKLNINFDYGEVEGTNLEGFDDRGINTTSFALGIRKAKFGASLNTDTYLEDNTGIMDNSRLGLELDWHFSDDTTLSFGTKQRLNNENTRASTLDSITGNVQYIKFKHNL